MRPFPAIAVTGLLLLSPVLVACGGADDGLTNGETVIARQDDQFAGRGTPSSVELPVGRLEVEVGDPVRSLTARDTRELQPFTAPDGAVFLPITWRYDTATFGSYAAYLGTDDGPEIDLLSDGATYRIPPPRLTGQGSSSFYVLVGGSATEPSLRVGFDGVTQTVDLTTGDVDRGAAAALYAVEGTTATDVDCGRRTAFTDSGGATTRPPTGGKVPEQTATADFDCTRTAALRLPYAGGAWAEQGRTRLALTVTTTLRTWRLLSRDLASGSLYGVNAGSATFTLDGAAPDAVLPDKGGSLCPDEDTGTCILKIALVFDVADGAGPFDLAGSLTYGLTLGPETGPVKAEPELDLTGSLRTRIR